MLERGRFLFLALAAGLVATLGVTLGRLPSRVASHFNAHGMPDGWLSCPAYALFIVAIGILVPLSIIGLVMVLTRSGVSSLNIPARDYWMRPEHSPEAIRRVRIYIWWLACILVAMALAIHWSVLAANARQPPVLGSGEFLSVLGLVVLAIGIWTAGWYRLLRPDRDHNSAPRSE
jgi:uncharacterized membrane protein